MARLYDEPQGGVGEADAVEIPANPVAQNAATAALKPKVQTVPTEALPGMEALDPQARPVASETNPDPNAYAPPPQQMEQATPLAGGIQTSVMPSVPEAAPTPLPQAAPISTLSGDWQAPTASATSAPLIASAAGGTMTPQGTKENSFLGYQTDVGKPGTAEGTFGGYGTAILPDAGVTMKDYDTKVGEAIKGFDYDFSQVDPAELTRLSAMSRNANGAETDQADALKMKAFRGEQLTPTEQYFLAFQSGQTPQVFRPEYGASGASPTGWKLSQNDMNALGGAKTMGEWNAKLAARGAAPSAPPPVNAGNWTPANPAEQAAGLAAQGLPQAAPVGAPATAAPEAAVPFGGVQNVPAQPALPQPSASGVPKTASGMGNVAQTAVTPENTLTNALLSRGEGADRFKIAQDQYKASEEASAPQYEADLRRAMRLAAAGGALGSGQLQTSLGDIAQNRDLFNRTNRTNFLSEALKGTIGDQFADVGVAQQQQGFQNQQQQQAFQQAIQKALTEDSLTGSGFSRALQMLTAGSGGNPADLAMTLSQIFGGQSSAAGSSLAGLLGGMGQKSTAPQGGTDINSLLSLIYGNKPGTTTTTPASTTVYGGQ